MSRHTAEGRPRLSGVELDPLYVHVIIRRYEATAAKSAVLVEMGEPFEPLAEGRAGEAAPV